MRLFLTLLAAAAVIAVTADGAEKKGKLFSLFNVVKFKNAPCYGNGERNGGSTEEGTCFSASECSDKGGTESGTCAAGFGVCCVITKKEDGDTIEYNNTYIRNDGQPDDGTSNLRFTIKKMACDICHLRFDFEAFTIQGPTDSFEQASTANGQCQDSFLVTTDTGGHSNMICGENTGKHMYVDIGHGCNDEATVVLAFSGDNPSNRNYDIKVAQIECSADWAPPAGCTEYLMKPAGTIMSYNFAQTTGGHLPNQEHLVCVRPTKSSCCVRYTQCADDSSFSLADNAGVSGTNQQCTRDYIAADSFTADCTRNHIAGAYRLCGFTLNVLPDLDLGVESVCDCQGDYRLLIHTDGLSDAAAPDALTMTINDAQNAALSRGVCFNYALVDC